MATINVNGHDVQAASQLKGGKYYVSDASQSNFLLIQCHNILQKEHYESFSSLKVHVLHYIEPNTYACQYEPADLEVIRSLPFVVYANVFHEDLALNRALVPSNLGLEALSSHGAAQMSRSIVGEDKNPYLDVYIAFHQMSMRTAAQMREVLSNMLKVEGSSIVIDGHRVRMMLRQIDLQRVARLDDVRHVEVVPEFGFNNNMGRQIMKFPESGGARMGMNDKHFSAKGEIIAVTDSGLDTGGDTKEIHKAFKDVKIEYLDTFNTGLPLKDDHGHGTHVCGSIVGSGTSTDFPVPIRGTATDATLIVQKRPAKYNPVVSSPVGPIGPTEKVMIPITEVLMAPYRSPYNARIHNNSWSTTLEPPENPGTTGVGSPLFVQRPYDETARELDNIVVSNPDYLIVFAAGNGNKALYGAMPTIGSLAAAKNILTIGASESNRPVSQGSHPMAALYYDEEGSQGNPDMITYFSSSGPVGNGRCKPDLVAPGLTIYSTRSQDPGVVDDGKAGESTDKLWTFKNGTSMAAPLVSGAAAVVRMHLRQKTKKIPTAALIKAILINSATDLFTRTEEVNGGFLSRKPAKKVPDNYQGFGRVNIAKAWVHINESAYGGFTETSNDPSPGAGASQPPQPLSQGSKGTFPVPIKGMEDAKSKTQPPSMLPITLTATLVYTDQPGPDLQNILILRANYKVKTTGESIEVFANGDSTDLDLQMADKKNNVQKLVWPNLPPDGVDVTLIVECIQVTGQNATQGYALVWYIDYGPPTDLKSDQKTLFQQYNDVGSSKWALEQLNKRRN